MGLESLRIKRGKLILVGVNSIKLFNVVYSIMNTFIQNQPFALHSVLEINKLNETNYADWIRILRIVLKAATKEDVLDNLLPEEPAANAPAAERNAHRRAVDNVREVSCLILACMEPELQMQFETNHEAHDMIVALQDMF